jgi:hypothetical protein
MPASRPQLPPDLKHRLTFNENKHGAAPSFEILPLPGMEAAGIPRGSLTEISGANSSGKTSFMLSAIAQATARNENAGLIDLTDTLDPQSAIVAGVVLDHLLWIRCGCRLEVALKAADILLHGGGYGLTVLNLGSFSHELLRKIPMMYWFRFRHAVANTPTAFVVMTPFHLTGSCASLALSAERCAARWAGNEEFLLLHSMEFRLLASRGAGSMAWKRASPMKHARIERTCIVSA